MRVTRWFLSFALLLILVDAGWERARRAEAAPVAEAGAVGFDGEEGQPPPSPRP